MLDIDRFKDINDNYGHIVGDKILIMLAGTLKDLARKSDIVVRFGGEEFIILLPQTEISEAKAIAERVRLAIEKCFLSLDNGEHIHITISIGISQSLQDDTKIDTIIQRADKGLYLSKEKGRNCINIYH